MLHAKCHLVLGDPRGDFGIPGRCQLLLVELSQTIQHLSTEVAIDPWRIRQVQHGIAAAAKLDTLMTGRQETGSPKPLKQPLIRILPGPV